MPDPELTLREATIDDIPILTKHRCWMFDDMIQNQTVGYTVADVVAMEDPYRNYLQDHLGTVIRAWVVEADGAIIASGAILFQQWAPRPGDLTGQSALLHSIYTAPNFRRRGLARLITEKLITVCQSAGIKTVNLHASDSGQPLYTLLGFHRTSEMRLVL